jgi:hypothetical protein
MCKKICRLRLVGQSSPSGREGECSGLPFLDRRCAARTLPESSNGFQRPALGFEGSWLDGWQVFGCQDWSPVPQWNTNVSIRTGVPARCGFMKGARVTCRLSGHGCEWRRTIGMRWSVTNQARRAITAPILQQPVVIWPTGMLYKAIAARLREADSWCQASTENHHQF